jgi:hypothetical protein
LAQEMKGNLVASGVSVTDGFFVTLLWSELTRAGCLISSVDLNHKRCVKERYSTRLTAALGVILCLRYFRYSGINSRVRSVKAKDSRTRAAKNGD